MDDEYVDEDFRGRVRSEGSSNDILDETGFSSDDDPVVIIETDEDFTGRVRTVGTRRPEE